MEQTSKELTLNSHKLYLAWRRQVFVRNPHPELHELFERASSRGGIYLIGCGPEIVYIGQTVNLAERPIDSLGRFYHRVPDITLPWSLALAPCSPTEMNELESTAIRTFAPRFNTSIPSIPASEGRMPKIIGHAAVFQDQTGAGRAFEETNLEMQMARARTDPAPPWRQGKQRPKTGKREPRPVLPPLSPPVLLSGDGLHDAWQHYGLPKNDPMVYPVNLCSDGSVVTRHGEYLGTWSADQYDTLYFIPDGETTPAMEHLLVGILCMSIRDWYERSHGEKL